MLLKHFRKQERHNLIYFQRAQTPDSQSDNLEARTQRQCEELRAKAAATPNPLYKEALEIVKLREQGRIDRHTFDEFAEMALSSKHKNNKDLLNFAIALRKGKFPEHAKGAFQFIRAIKGTTAQQTAAHEELQKLAQSEAGTISKHKYLTILRKIRDPQNPLENLLQQNTAGILSDIANTREQIEDLENRLSHHHWQPKDVPEALRNSIRAKEGELQTLMQESNELIVKKDLSTTEKKRLKELDQLIPKKLRELSTPLEQQKKIFSDNIKRKNAIDNWSEKLGFKFNDQRLKYTSESGHQITIQNVKFDPGNTSTPFIEYQDHTGATIDINAGLFLKNCTSNHIYQQVDNIDQLNEIIAFSNGRKPLAVGDKFETSTGTEAFTISAIGTTDIELDKEVTLRPDNSSGPAPTYSEIKKKTLNLGEFSKYISQKQLRRTITLAETPEVIRKNHQSQQEQIAQSLSALTDNQKEIFQTLHQNFGPFTPPASPDQPTEIFYYDRGHLRRAQIELKKPQTGLPHYQITEKKPETLDLQALSKANVPLRLLNVPLADIPSKTPKVLNLWQLVDLSNDGNIINFDPTKLPTPEPEIDSDQPADQTPPSQEPPLPPSNEPDDDDQPPKKLSEEEEKLRNEQTILSGIDKEALPYHLTYIPGTANISEEHYLRQLYSSVSLYSPQDIWQLFKDIKEYWDRNFDRKQNERVGKLGERLPFYEQDFRAKRQSAETQAVNQYKEALSEFDQWSIENVLRSTRNQDEMKAAFMTLSEKGWLRWDDIEMWQNLNQFVTPSLRIPIPENGEPYTVVDPETGKTGFSYLKDAIDTIWDQGTYNEWVNKNNSAFNSGKEGYVNEVEELGSADGGYEKELTKMLKDHKEGIWVDPHRYEEYISHAISEGKSSVEAKVFYLIQGIAIKSPSGRSLINFERLRQLNSKHLGHFPIIDFFTEAMNRFRQENGEIVKSSSKVSQRDIEAWSDFFREDGLEPGAKTKEFLWDYLLVSDRLQNRLDKMMRGAGSQIDHDDTQAFGPFLTATALRNFCQSSSGNHKATSLLGYINIYGGLSQAIKTTSKIGRTDKLIQVMNNFFLFDAIMRERYEHSSATYQRWRSEDYYSRPYGYAGRAPAELAEEFFNIMRETLDNYEAQYSNDPQKLQVIREARESFEFGISDSKCQGANSTESARKIDGFEKHLKALSAIDDGAVLLNTVNNKRVEGKVTGIFEYEQDREYRKQNNILPPQDFIHYKDGKDNIIEQRNMSDYAVDPNYRSRRT